MNSNRKKPSRTGLWMPSRGGVTLRKANEGRWGYILAWLVGVPIPILLLVYLLRGCT